MGNYISDKVRDVSLTKSQKKIAEYFIQNQDRIGTLSLIDIANEIGVSDASIIRFARAIGFSGYAELKEKVYEELVKNASGQVSLSERLTKNAEKYNGAIDTGRFLDMIQENIAASFRDNRAEDFEEIAKAIADAQQRYVIGMRGMRGLAVKFGRLLSFMLPEVRTLTDGECTSLMNLQDITDRDVLIMFVFSRFYKVDLQYVQMVKARGAKIYLITNEITGPLSAYADRILTAACANMSFFHSTIGVDIIAEYLLDLISTQVDFRNRIDERDELTADQRL